MKNSDYRAQRQLRAYMRRPDHRPDWAQSADPDVVVGVGAVIALILLILLT